MEKLKTVTGTWRGVYDYEASEKMPSRKSVPFRLALKQGWFGHFTGSVNDDPKLGMPETGGIDGYFSFPKIEFTKLMPVSHVALPDGRRMTLRESLIERGYPCDREVPHRPIFYQGKFADLRHAKGIWVIEPGPLLLRDGAVLSMPGSKGTWVMEAEAEVNGRHSASA